MRLVFMGTPEFAVPSLEKLLAGDHAVVGVVTPPDRPKGRGLRVSVFPVKQKAITAGIPVAQPEDLKDLRFIRTLRQWKADCFAVVAFRILPREVYGMPPKGTVNLHASLLPKYRGAAPIHWAILRGEKETGVTTFFIEERVDTGDWILQEKTTIGPEETAGELHDRLAVMGADCLARTMDLIASGQATRTPQQGVPTTAPKILPVHCRIDWSRPADSVVNLIRGLSPRPGAFTFWNGKRLKCLKAIHDPESATEAHPPGTVLKAGKEGLTVSAGGGRVVIRSVQLESGEPMDVDTFLRGHRLVPGMVFGASDAA
jgi:methionyl-tRNA formyltransferase